MSQIETFEGAQDTNAPEFLGNGSFTAESLADWSNIEKRSHR